MNVVGFGEKNAMRRVVTGKTITAGGSYGRESATGAGVVHCIEEWAKDHRFNLNGSSFIVQGFGNVGSHTAKLLKDADMKVVAISDISGGYYRPDGVDVLGAIRHANQNKNSLEGYKEAERITNEELLELEVDILIPAALGGVINDTNGAKIRAPIIIEAANEPVRPEANDALINRGVVIVPDVLANAGGVTVSYFEWAQNRQFYHWNLDRVRQELERVMSMAFDSVWDLSRERKVNLRTAAFMLGIERVARATELSGIE
jgi:glutamate dehydrogenase (NAD(P)+)